MLPQGWLRKVTLLQLLLLLLLLHTYMSNLDGPILQTPPRRFPRRYSYRVKKGLRYDQESGMFGAKTSFCPNWCQDSYDGRGKAIQSYAHHMFSPQRAVPEFPLSADFFFFLFQFRALGALSVFNHYVAMHSCADCSADHMPITCMARASIHILTRSVA